VNWDQLKTILWLRWRLTRNQWARSKGFGAVLSAVAAVGVFMMGGTSFCVAMVVGIFGLGKGSPVFVWGVWAGLTIAFLFLWLVGLLVELQRSESIDLQRLLHLPVALGQIFVINYIASHLTPSIVILVPAMMGMALGLAISRGPSMLLLAPLAASMVLMISAWTYCLRGWLATLMGNPRKRRTVIMVIMFTFVLMGQGPNLYFNVFRRMDRPAPGATSEKTPTPPQAQKHTNRDEFAQLRSVQKYIPPLWLPLGAQALAEGNALPDLCGTLGCLAIGTLGLRRAYRSTLRFYRGDPGGKITARIQPSQKPAVAAIPVKAGRRFLEWRLPAVPEQAAALALATFRGWLRAPEVKMAWGTSFFVTIIAVGSSLYRGTPKMPEAAKPFIATGAAVFSIFLLVQFFTNQFGFDRDGFRALILSPVERRLILLGKNIACVPVGAGFGVVLLSLICVRLHLSPLTFVAGLLQLAALLMLAGLIGNVLSIMMPYRIQSGTMKPTKLPGLAMLVLMLCQMTFPIAMAPAFLPPLAELLWQSAGWSKMVPINLILSATLAGVVALAYWQTLGPLGHLLQRRETKILGVVTVEVE
jgi:ABC-2 type transport system permease protein